MGKVSAYVGGLVSGVLLSYSISLSLRSTGTSVTQVVAPAGPSECPEDASAATSSRREILVPSRPRPSPQEVDRWMSSFKAADPDFQDYCLRRLRGKPIRWDQAMGSQTGQDMYMFRNLFLGKAVRGEPGFYVDSGANHWALNSNTVFYDKCLGWKGLCVEPIPKYHANLTERRSCHLLAECISDAEGTRLMSKGGDQSSIGHGDFEVRCRPLSAMLEEVGAEHVDFWSLDVEGHEMVVLNGGVPFDKINTILIENFWLSTRVSDRFLNNQNYMKYSQMPIDGLFVRLGDEIWYPNNWETLWHRQEVFRERVRARLAKDQ